MENQLIGYELFINGNLYPEDYIISYNHKLYTNKEDAKMALKDLRIYFDNTTYLNSKHLCYRPVYLTYSNTGKHVLEYKNDFYVSLHCNKYRKKVYESHGVQDYQNETVFDFYDMYHVHNIKYGKPIF